MARTVFTSALNGYESQLVNVECELSNGLPSIVIVGLPGKSVDESKERVRSAMTNSRLVIPKKRITLNLAPADLPKQGSSFDLSLAVAILYRSNQIEIDSKKYMFLGEVSLNGDIKAVKGALAHVQLAKKLGIETVVLPKSNLDEASLVQGIRLLAPDNLKQLVSHLKGEVKITNQPNLARKEHSRHKLDFSDIHGQPQAKRAMQIVAAGGHNIIMSGPPGTGKSMLAKALPSILPPMNYEEIIEATNIHSIAGNTDGEIISNRPVRSPHHTSSYISVIGGGKVPQPGEVSLSHRGVLFLDELPEYTRQVLETLRQPLEDKTVNIARAEGRVSFPANFTLVATQNPCPCGYYGDTSRECICTPHQINQYSKKISGPLLDRIDLAVTVGRVDNKQLLLQHSAKETSSDMQKKVLAARKIQTERFGSPTILNSDMNNRELAINAKFTDEAKDIFDRATRELKLSSRSYVKMAKVSRTIADLDSSKEIFPEHVSEAIQYRIKTNI